MPSIHTVSEVGGSGGELDGLGRPSYQRKFLVIAANRQFRQSAIIGAVTDTFGIEIGTKWYIGSPGVPWHEDLEIYCNRITCDQRPDNAAIYWDVVCHFEPVDPENLGLLAIPENPADAPIRIEWGEWAESYVVDKDREGNVLLNTAGVRFADPVDAERHYPLLRIKRYERWFNPYYAGDYRDAVNASDWQVWDINVDARNAKCLSITAQVLWHHLIGVYHDVSYEFALKNNDETWEDVLGQTGQGWDLRAQNVGFFQKTSPTSVEVIRDANGYPVSYPVPLDADGVAIALPLSTSLVMPTVNFRVLKERDFDNFQFPIL